MSVKNPENLMIWATSTMVLLIYGALAGIALATQMLIWSFGLAALVALVDPEDLDQVVRALLERFTKR